MARVSTTAKMMTVSGKITKAIFPVAGLGSRFLPATKAVPKEMLTILDRPLIQYAVMEAIEAGIDEFIFITAAGKSAIENHFSPDPALELTLENRQNTEALGLIREAVLDNATYIDQHEPLGLGHAIGCARHLIGAEEAVAVILPDDLILDEADGRGCLAQMIEAWQGLGGIGTMMATMAVAPDKTASYGIITPCSESPKNSRFIEIKGLVEKPDPADAPSNWAVIGRYILEPGVFDALAQQEQGAGGEIQLTDALAQRIGQTPTYAFTINGDRYDCGTQLGFIQANIATALASKDLAQPLRLWLKNRLG